MDWFKRQGALAKIVIAGTVASMFLCVCITGLAVIIGGKEKATLEPAKMEQTVAQAVQATLTAIPTATPYPTYTPVPLGPTYTPYPTYTPKPTLKPPPTNTPIPTKKAAATPTKAMPTPTATPKPAVTWHKVKKWIGSGIKSTEQFQISGKEWRVNWTNKRAGEVFQIYLYKGEEMYWKTPVLANTMEAGSDTSYIHEGGTFYLTINATGTWVVEVEAKY